MVQKTNQNLEMVRRFKIAMKKEIKVDKLIFFGSRVKGTFGRYSDFDLMVVSKDFNNIPWYKRPAKLYMLWNEDYPVEILCYTPDEIKRKKGDEGIVSEAIRTGVVV